MDIPSKQVVGTELGQLAADFESVPYIIQYIPIIVLIDELGIIKYKGSAPGSVNDLRMLIDNSLK